MVVFWVFLVFIFVLELEVVMNGLVFVEDVVLFLKVNFVVEVWFLDVFDRGEVFV